MTMRKGLSLALAAGAIAGGVAGLVVVLASGGGLAGSASTVTVQQTPVVVDGGARNAGLSASAIYAQDATGVVFVDASGVSEAQSPAELIKGEGGGQGTATGSGFEVDRKGTILTNWHVVQNATSVTVGFQHGRTVKAQIVARDPTHDIAVLRVPIAGVTLHPLALGDSSGVQVGEPVAAIGNPFGLGGTLTTGVISALDRQIQSPTGARIEGALQTDAPINPGNSGGPLLDSAGAVIGINSQIETASAGGGNVGIAFAIPIDDAKTDLEKVVLP